MKKTLAISVIGAALALGAVAVGQTDATTTTTSDQNTSVKQDMKTAGHATKNATKKTGHKVKHTTKKVVHKGARKTRHGAAKVEDKTDTSTQPQ